jgi:hypothetical protein
MWWADYWLAAGLYALNVPLAVYRAEHGSHPQRVNGQRATLEYQRTNCLHVSHGIEDHMEFMRRAYAGEFAGRPRCEGGYHD